MLVEVGKDIRSVLYKLVDESSLYVLRRTAKVFYAEIRPVKRRLSDIFEWRNNQAWCKGNKGQWRAVSPEWIAWFASTLPPACGWCHVEKCFLAHVMFGCIKGNIFNGNVSVSIFESYLTLAMQRRCGSGCFKRKEVLIALVKTKYVSRLFVQAYFRAAYPWGKFWIWDRSEIDLVLRLFTSTYSHNRGLLLQFFGPPRRSLGHVLKRCCTGEECRFGKDCCDGEFERERWMATTTIVKCIRFSVKVALVFFCFVGVVAIDRRWIR